MERTRRYISRLQPEEVGIINKYPIEERLIPLRNEINEILATFDRHYLYRDVPTWMNTVPVIKDVIFRLLLTIQLLPAAQHLKSRYSSDSVLVSLSKLIPHVSNGDIDTVAIGDLLNSVMHDVTDENIWLRVYELLGQPHDIIVIAEYREGTPVGSFRHKRIEIPYGNVKSYEEIVEIAKRLRDPWKETVTNATYTFIRTDDWRHYLEGPEPVFLLRFNEDNILVEPDKRELDPEHERILVECFYPQEGFFSCGLLPHQSYMLKSATIKELKQCEKNTLKCQSWYDDDRKPQHCTCKNKSSADVVMRYSNAAKLESFLLEENRSLWDYRLEPGGIMLIAWKGGCTVRHECH